MRKTRTRRWRRRGNVETPRGALPFGRAQALALVLFGVPWAWLAFRAGALPGVFVQHWPVMATMVVGSFVAGVSAAGGGAVAFPVMTLLLGVPPPDARDFTLLIQSAGMGAASAVIVATRTKVDWLVIAWAGLGSSLGMWVGLGAVAPLVPARAAKLAFAAVFLSFAGALWYMNRASEPGRQEQVSPRTWQVRALLIVLGMVGGVLAAVFGTGDDLWVFSVVVLGLGLCEKVGTPTSVVLMAGTSILGALLRLKSGEVAPVTLERWLACVPVVIVGAPLGARVCARRLSRRQVAWLLIGVLVVEFVGALVVLRPSGLEALWMTAASLAAAAGYGWMARYGLGRLRP